MTAFGRRVLEATAAIPYGSVSTYGEVAAHAGSPRGSRAAGNSLGANPLPIVLPCHRVVHSGGGLGGYTGGVARKRTLLAIESGRPAAPTAYGGLGSLAAWRPSASLASVAFAPRRLPRPAAGDRRCGSLTTR